MPQTHQRARRQPASEPARDAASKVTSPASETSSRLPRKLSAESRQARDLRAARTREQLIDSAARVVGEHGYRDASVQRITGSAGVAQGTFYLYFKSRQALFDELLPFFGKQMLEHVRERTLGIADFFDAEEAGMRAVLEYQNDNPWFWRVLVEAEIEAPVAYGRHSDEVMRRYVKFLQRAHAAGELKAYQRHELPTVARLLIAARDYIQRGLDSRRSASKQLQNAMVETYRTFISGGLGRRP